MYAGHRMAWFGGVILVWPWLLLVFLFHAYLQFLLIQGASLIPFSKILLYLNPHGWVLFLASKTFG
jgi:hypothetical protein